MGATMNVTMPRLVLLGALSLGTAGCGGGGGGSDSASSGVTGGAPALEVVSYAPGTLDSGQDALAAGADLVTALLLSNPADMGMAYEPDKHEDVSEDPSLPVGSWEIAGDCPEGRYKLTITHVGQWHYPEDPYSGGDEDDDLYDSDCEYSISRDDPIEIEGYDRAYGPGDSMRFEFGGLGDDLLRLWGAYEWVVEAGWLGDEEAITPELTRVRYEYEALQLQLTLPTGETLRSYQDGGYTLETESGERLTVSGERFAFEQPLYYRDDEPPVQTALELTDFEVTVTRTCPKGSFFCLYDQTVTGRGRPWGRRCTSRSLRGSSSTPPLSRHIPRRERCSWRTTRATRPLSNLRPMQ